MIQQISRVLEGLSRRLEYMGQCWDKPVLCSYYRKIKDIRDEQNPDKPAKKEFYYTKCYIRNLEKKLFEQGSKEYARKLMQCRYALKEAMGYGSK